MKIAHLSLWAPRASGLYEATKDLIKYERKLGLESEFVESDVKDPDPKQFTDEWLTAKPWSWAQDADILVVHRSLPNELANKKPKIVVMHGPIEIMMMFEHSSEKDNFNFNINLIWDYDVCVAITPQDYEIAQHYDEKGHLRYIEDAIDLERYSLDGWSWEYKYHPAIISADTIRLNKIPLHIILAMENVRKKIPDARLNFFSIPLIDVTTWRNVFVRSKLRHNQNNCELIQLMTGDIRPFIRGADISFNNNLHGIHSRGSVMEAMACFPSDTFVVADNITDTHERFYSGDIITIETNRGIIEATPEHPFWTGNKWTPANKLTFNHQLWYSKEYTIGGGYGKKKLQKVYSGAIREIVRSLQNYDSQGCGRKNGTDLRASVLANSKSRNTQINWSEDNFKVSCINRDRVGLLGGVNRRRGGCNNKETCRATRRQLETEYQCFQHITPTNGMAVEKDRLSEYLSCNTQSSWKSCNLLSILDNRDRVFANVRETTPVISNKEKAMPLDSSMVAEKIEAGSTRENQQETTRDYPNIEGFKPETIIKIGKRKVENLPVYNLSTDSHVYVAKGFIVHNCGIPVVAYCGGEDYTPYIAKTWCLESIAEAIEQCWKDIQAKGRDTVARECRTYAKEHFNMKKAAVEYKKLYEELL